MLTHLECYCLVRFCCKQEILPWLIRWFNTLFIRWHEAMPWCNGLCYLGIIHLQTENKNIIIRNCIQELDAHFALNKLYSETRFTLFWTVKITWLSMTFSSFPWPRLSRCSRSIVKIIYYLWYFPTLRRMERVLVYIFTGIKTSFLNHMLFILLLIFCSSSL